MEYLLTIKFIAEHYLALSVFLFISYILGRKTLIKMPLHGIAERIFLCVSLGIGITIVLLFCISAFKLLNKLFISSVLLLAMAICLPRKIFTGFLPELFNGLKRISVFLKKNWYWLLPASLVLSPLLLLPLYPPTAWDEIAYHLPYARHYVENNGLSLNPYLRYPLYSHNINLLYSLSLLFYDDVFAHLLHASCALLVTLGIYSLGSMVSDKKTGVLASIIFISSPLILHLMKTAYIELGLAMFVFLSFYFLILWSRSKNSTWLLFSGFAAGISAGSKYLGLLYIVFFVIWIAVESRKITPVIKFLLIAVIFGSPWYIRNYIISGDPFFPFGGDVFGYSWLWDKNDLLSQIGELKSRGTPHNLISLLLLPWNLIFKSGMFMEGKISFFMLAVFPSFVFFKRFDNFYKKLTVLVYANIIFWFFSTQILRYLTCLFPLMALLSAAVLLQFYHICLQSSITARFLDSLKRFLSIPVTKIISSLIITIFILIIIFIYRGDDFAEYAFNNTFFAKYYSPEFHDVFNEKIPYNKQIRKDYLNRRIDSFELLQIANKEPSLNIYQFGFGNSFPVYYAHGMMIGDWFGPARYSIITKVLDNPSKLYDTLISMDINLFLVHKDFALMNDIRFDESYSKYFNLIKKDGNIALYELTDSGGL